MKNNSIDSVISNYQNRFRGQPVLTHGQVDELLLRGMDILSKVADGLKDGDPDWIRVRFDVIEMVQYVLPEMYWAGTKEVDRDQFFDYLSHCLDTAERLPEIGPSPVSGVILDFDIERPHVLCTDSELAVTGHTKLEKLEMTLEESRRLTHPEDRGLVADILSRKRDPGEDYCDTFRFNDYGEHYRTLTMEYRLFEYDPRHLRAVGTLKLVAEDQMKWPDFNTIQLRCLSVRDNLARTV